MDIQNEKSILTNFVKNLEEKLSSVKLIHEQLFQLINLLSKTNQNILEDLTNIKQILNQNQILSESNNSDQSSIKQFNSNSPSTRASLFSPSSFNSLSSINSLNNDNRPNSSISKRSSNLKKSTIRPKSPKSVTFDFDQQQISSNEIIQEEDSNQKENSDLIPNLFKEHHHEVTNKQNIGFKLGNALTNIRIHEIESINGDYLRLLNISNSDDYDLGGHFIQQNIACVPISRFKFPFNTIIRAGQTVTIWCGSFKDIEAQPPHIFIWKEKRRWEIGPECLTILAKPTGQAIAWTRSSNRINSDQSSSDILFVHSKSNVGTSDSISNSFKSRSRLSSYNFIGNNKPPFAHSPSNPIHPNHNGNDLRSQMHQRIQLLNRPKSSPFSSHIGCKQDLISMNFLRNQRDKQTTIQT